MLHHFHEADTYNPVEPAGLLVRLQTLGCQRITVPAGRLLMFAEHKSEPEPEPDRIA
ncbi:MAG: hypothetical protein ACR2NR_04860 [Solirubrobacteraceae bacterium]